MHIMMTFIVSWPGPWTLVPGRFDVSVKWKPVGVAVNMHWVLPDPSMSALEIFHFQHHRGMGPQGRFRIVIDSELLTSYTLLPFRCLQV